MDNNNFRKSAHQVVDWIADYLEKIEDFPVKSNLEPGEIFNALPGSPPDQGESFDNIFTDFQQIILPGMTHWQHPRFHAYFPGNSSKPSILGEMITSAIGAQCMMWVTSPAAAELEEKMINWLKEMLDLPSSWEGVIQDTASTATLCAILSARENFSKGKINDQGFIDQPSFTIYCSNQAHSSVEKAVRIAGLGSGNLRKIGVDDNYAMLVDELKITIDHDIKKGHKPLCIVAALGTTGSTAIDPIKKIGQIASKYKIWFHVDAAYAGTALLLPEMRWMSKGLEFADSFVFNPHKWMFTNFDCSAYYVKDKHQLIETFSTTPEYLRTKEDMLVNNYKDWGIQLGRRFRALKLWFVIRSYGVVGLREKIAEHIKMGKWFKEQVEGSDDFELMAPAPLNTICFRFNPNQKTDLEPDQLNEQLLERLNSSGKVFMTHTKLNGNYTIRAVFGQTEVKWRHVKNTWNLICQEADLLVS